MTSPLSSAMSAVADRLPALRRVPAKQLAHRVASSVDLALLFSRLVTARGRTPPTRFVIFGQGRSGSTLLVDLLNSNDRVFCEKEILSRRVPFPARYVQARSTLSPRPVYGFKVKIYQLTKDQGLADPADFLRDLDRRGWKIIYLWRRNVLRQSLSNLIAEQRHLYHQTVEDGGVRLDRLTIDCGDLRRRLDERDRYLREEAAVLRDFPHTAVQYEADLLDAGARQATLDRIFDYLGIPRATVSTKLARINDKRLPELLANFDEVAASLSGTPYAEHLSEG